MFILFIYCITVSRLGHFRHFRLVLLTRLVSFACLLETGTLTSHPVGARLAWWCITSPPRITAWAELTCTSGTMTGATWSTTLSANMNQVKENMRQCEYYSLWLLCLVTTHQAELHGVEFLIVVDKPEIIGADSSISFSAFAIPKDENQCIGMDLVLS